MVNKILQRLNEKRLPLIAGVLVGTTYIPFPPWALLFCYVPLWLYLLKVRNLKEAFWGAWWTQFVLSLIGFHWIAYTAKEFGAMPWAISVLALLLFATFIHLYIPLIAVIAVYLRQKFSLGYLSSLFSIALLHGLIERIWPSIFPWHLGYTLIWAKLPVYQLADLVGFEGLSTWILLFNAWFAWMWIQHLQKNKKVRLHLAAAVAVFAALNLWGHFHKNSWNEFDADLKVAVIQANIGNMEKTYAEQGRGYQNFITDKFLRLSQQAVQKWPETELLLWPETAYPDYLDAEFLEKINQRQLITGLSNIQRPLLTGAYSKDQKLNLRLDRATFNALFLVRPDGSSYSPPYRKTYLLAFGEYLPFSERFPILLKWLPFVSNFGRGPGPSTLSFTKSDNTKVDIGGQICYEGLYADFTQGLALKGSEVLANVTNDSWFGYPFEPRQHLYMTLARAIEVRRPLIRSTNTGISTAILANGEILEQSPIHEEWVGLFHLRYKTNAPQTFFVQYGHRDWILIIILLIATLSAGAYHVTTRRS